MALDVPVADMVTHDGSEIIWPSAPEPLRRAGFHIQEMIDQAYRLGYLVTPFQAAPISGHRHLTSHYIPRAYWDGETRLREVMPGNIGVVTGQTLLKQEHAIAWDGLQVFDSGDQIRSLAAFQIECFYLISPITWQLK